MQSKYRLTRSEDFKRVRQSGRSYAHPLMVLVARTSETDHLRVGVTAGKASGSAVHRNRAKRMLREAIRPRLPELKPGWDLILIARPALVSASLDETRAALITLLHRAGILNSDEI